MAQHSQVWKYFSKSGEGLARCDLCYKQYQHSGNTSNLRKHLKSRHSKDLSAPSATSTPTKAPSSPACSFASSSSQSFIDSIFNDVSSMQSGAKKSALTNIITIMIVKDNLPIDHVHGEGFKLMMKNLAPHYLVPDRKTIRRKIDTLYNRMIELKREEIANVKNISMTFDLWKDTHNQSSYLGITGHYIKDWEICSVLLSCFIMTERHTSENICKSLNEVLKFWNIDSNKVVACVTDNGANVKKAVGDWIGQTKHIPCFAHTLNLVVKDAINNAGNFKDILVKVRSIVQYFRQSGPAADELHKVQPQNKILKLKQDVETRWNSSYLMLARYIEIQDYVNLALSHLNDAPPSVTGAEKEIIEDALKILKPFFSITEEMSAEKVVTLSKVIPIQYCLVSKIREMKLDTAVATFLQKSLIKGLDERFHELEDNMITVISCILDPRFKKVYIQSAIALSKALGIIDKLLPSASPPPTEIVDDEDNDEDDVWAVHDKLATKRHQSDRDAQVSLSSKLKLYLDATLVGRKANPLITWSAIQSSFWEISQLAPMFLCIPATSVPSERLFSKAGSTLNEKRNRLKPESVNKILFLNSLTVQELKSFIE